MPHLSARSRVRAVGAAVGVVLAAGVLTAAVGFSSTEEPAPVAAEVAAEAAAPAVPVDPPALQQPPAASRARVAPPAVRALSTLREPDLLVTVRTPLTPAQVKAVDDVRGVEGVTVLDAGTVRVGGKGARIVGVDPSQFRQFTPKETAQSDALWQVVARGELVSSYGVARARKLPLGKDVQLVGLRTTSERLGGVAALGIPGVDLVLDRAGARALGVQASTALLVSAPDRGLKGLRRAVRDVVGADAEIEVLRQVEVQADSSRPKSYRELYQRSARYCPGLSWTVLAAIGQVESAHGKHLGPSSAGALGPMQFLPSTWAAYGVDGDGDGAADIMSPFDAVPSAALYLCRFGANRGPEGLYDAIYAYNHADWYVKKVLAIAAQYR